MPITSLKKNHNAEFNRVIDKDVVLKSGLNVINSEKNAPFKLEGVKGRTLVNWLGRDGKFENASNWEVWANKSWTFNNNTVKITGSGVAINPQLTYRLKLKPNVGDSLFLRVKAKAEHATKAIRLYLYASSISTIFGSGRVDNPTIGQTYDLYTRIDVTQSLVDNWSNVGFKLVAEYETASASLDKAVVFWQPALHKVASSDMLLTDDQLLLQYPYVDSIRPVTNPYAIRYGENIFPSFDRFTTASASTLTVQSPYEATLTFNGVGGGWGLKIPAIANQTYALSYTSSNTENAYINIQWFDMNGKSLGWTPKNKNGQIITSPNNASTMQLYVTQDASGGGTFKFTNPMLVLGSNPKQFKPREDSMLALQTELFANPWGGSDSDEIFYKENQAFRLAKWKRLIIDGSEDWNEVRIFSGYKCVRMNPPSDMGLLGEINISNGAVMTKFDGSIMGRGTVGSGGDKYQNSSNGYFYINIFNTDSGWGESYTPTLAEVKAYFLGWRMMIADNWTTPYDGTGTKGWCKMSPSGGLVSASGTTVLPTVKNDQGWTPYEMIYQMKTLKIEPIVSEGMLTLHEGDNIVEVGTGLILRESVQPYIEKQPFGLVANINNVNYTQSAWLKNKTLNILNVYKNSAVDLRWVVMNSAVTTRGSLAQFPYVENKDMKDNFSVTYIMQDQFPNCDFKGKVSANERGVINSLVQNTDELKVKTSALSAGLYNSKFVELYSGSASANETIIDLSESLNDFDCLHIVFSASGYESRQIYHKTQNAHYIKTTNLSDNVSNISLATYEMKLSQPNDRQIKIDFNKLWLWSGSNTTLATVTDNTGISIRNIYGVKNS